VTDDPTERAARQARLQETEAAFDPLPFDAPAARTFGRLAANLRRGGPETTAASPGRANRFRRRGERPAPHLQPERLHRHPRTHGRRGATSRRWLAPSRRAMAGSEGPPSATGTNTLGRTRRRVTGRSVADGNRQGLGKLVHSAVEAAGLGPAPCNCPGHRTLNLYWGAFRGSEPVAMTWVDAHEVEQGVEWHVRSSKSDQLGHGESVGAVPQPQAAAVLRRQPALVAAHPVRAPGPRSGTGRTYLRPARRSPAPPRGAHP
jgi:hypothetical protein